MRKLWPQKCRAVSVENYIKCVDNVTTSVLINMTDRAMLRIMECVCCSPLSVVFWSRLAATFSRLCRDDSRQNHEKSPQDKTRRSMANNKHAYYPVAHCVPSIIPIMCFSELSMCVGFGVKIIRI